MSHVTPDRKLIRRHLADIDSGLRNLALHAGRSRNSLEADPAKMGIVDRELLRCVRSASEIAVHLCAALGAAPADASAAVGELGARGVLPAELATRLREVVASHDALGRDPGDADVSLLHSLLNDRLGELSDFAEHVLEYLESQES
jgi:uncharacterized protein YutE (UPF0331/DUF86 family)